MVEWMRRLYASILVLVALMSSACTSEIDTATTSTVTTSTVAVATTSTTVVSESVLIAGLRSFAPEELFVGLNDAEIASMADTLCRTATAVAIDQPDGGGLALVERILDASATDTIQEQWFILMRAMITFPICDGVSTAVFREAQLFLYEVLDDRGELVGDLLHDRDELLDG